MKAKSIIYSTSPQLALKILNQLELSSVEKELLKVNTGLISTDIPRIVKLGNDGILDLLKQINTKLTIQNLKSALNN